MFRLVIVFAVLQCFFFSSAQACWLPAHRTNSEDINSAPIAFVGTVVKVGEVQDAGIGSFPIIPLTFKVQKAIRGVKDGQLHETKTHAVLCGHQFRMGQRYLILGESQPWRASLLLENSRGQSNKENIAFVMRETGIKEANESLSLKGIAESNCISLENGIKVYLSSTFEEWLNREAQHYEDIGDGLQIPLSVGPIDMGDTFEMCNPKNKSCSKLKGRLLLGDLTEDEISGRIDISEGKVTTARTRRRPQEKIKELMRCVALYALAFIAPVVLLSFTIHAKFRMSSYLWKNPQEFWGLNAIQVSIYSENALLFLCFVIPFMNFYFLNKIPLSKHIGDITLRWGFIIFHALAVTFMGWALTLYPMMKRYKELIDAAQTTTF